MSEQGSNPPDAVDPSRRKFLVAATSAVGLVGVGFVATPFVASWKPSERARALGAPTEIDLTKLEVGQMVTQIWRKKPIYVVRRSPEMVAALSKHDGDLKDPKSENSEQPDYARNEMRATQVGYLVVYANCTHLGCLPKSYFNAGDPAVGTDWPGGFFCPCHGSKFDLAGRVFNGSPASVNLRIPPHSFTADGKVVIGVDPVAAQKGAA
jgi:ubiquinol-cytochrome c reductase iron-sulfur subunit